VRPQREPGAKLGKHLVLPGDWRVSARIPMPPAAAPPLQPNLAKILKCAGSDDAITLRAEDEGDSVAFVFEDKGAFLCDATPFFRLLSHRAGAPLLQLSASALPTHCTLRCFLQTARACLTLSSS